MKSFTSLILAFTFLLAPIGAIADTSNIQAQINAVQAERTKLLEQQKKLEAALNELNKESQTLTGNIKTLDATRTKLQNDLKITQSGIKKSDLSIQSLTDSISENEHEIAAHTSAIAEAIVELSAYDKHTMVYNLLTYKNFSDVWVDATHLSDLQDNLQDEINTLRGVQTELAKNKAAKEAEKATLKSLEGQLSGQKQVVEETKSAKAKLLAETKNQEAAYQKLLADNRRRQEEFERLLFQFESQLKAASPGSAPSASHSILSWPLSTVRVTQQFGRTSSSGRLYASGTHNGIDFGIPTGSAVMAARGGVVKGQGNTDSQAGCYSYGRWILVEHDNGLSTIYTHLSSSIVSNGTVVSTGQVIGYSGGQPGVFGSGYSTGPHLHFGVFVTAGVRIQQYSSSINCKTVSIPIANPSDYLDPIAYLPKL